MSLLEALVGQTLDNKYRIEKQLGQGGMGAVYLATHVGTLRPVAVKVISPQFMAYREFVERFKREAEAAGKLRHPNVVNVTDFGFAQFANSQVAYLVMEYLDGCNLGDVLKEEKKLPLSWVVDILEQTCLAVDKAHNQGIIHRDLKPDNIWLEPNERGGFTVKVLDFGLAKLNNSITSANEETENKIPNTSDDSVTSKSGLKVNAEFQEAITNVQVSIDTEGQTAVQLLVQKPVSNVKSSFSSNGDEEKTAVQLSSNKANKDSNADEEKTAVQPPAKTTKGDASNSTQNVQKLTQVGAVLGTPLYMSPEQCIGETLDKRTDIYSLGVIAYEMLAGEVPFTGNFNALMIQHLNSPPPSLQEKRPDIPKAVVELIMTALSKKAEDRPISAGAFANALRARSESASSVLRQVLGLYTERFSTFFQISLIAAIPMMAMSIIFIIQLILARVSPKNSINNILGIIGLIGVVLHLIAARALNSGVSIPILAQILIAPLKEISIRPAVEMLKKRLKMFVPISLLISTSEVLLVISSVTFFIVTSIVCYELIQEFIKTKTVQVDSSLIKAVIIILVSFLITISTSKIFVDYSLYASVIMMEGIGGIKALRKAKELVFRTKNITRPILYGYLIYVAGYGLLISLINRFIVVKLGSTILAAIVASVVYVFNVGVFILINPLVAIFLGLLYFKSQQTSGESLKDILGKYQPEALELSNWQKRISRNPTSLLNSLKRTNS